MLLVQWQRACLGGESLLNLLWGVGRTEWGWQWSQIGVFPGHQRTQPPWLLLVSGESPACSASEVGEGAWLRICWERTIEFVNEFKGAVCDSVDLTGLKAPSKCLLGPAVLCGRLRCGFLPSSSFLDSQVKCTRIS